MIVNGQKIKPPCGKACPRRAVGCHSSCLEWADYVERRDKEYDNRADIMRINDAIHDGYDRIARIHRGR